MAKQIGIANLIGLCFGLSALAAVAAPPQQQRVFVSAEQAVEALIAAHRDDQLGELSRILGPGGYKLIHSGDPVADRNHRARFIAAYDSAHRIEYSGEARATLVVGAEEWPLPIPLIRTGSGWHFDTPAAKQEILNRRIGRNELSVIEVCRAYVAAQREYATLAAAATGRPEYAQRFASRTGSHDGLYWPTTAGEPASPLGPLLALARAGGYDTDSVAGMPQPYHGYIYAILTRQGAHAPGGARDFIVDGHMTGGFALVAYPAVYGNSGIMTFIVSQDGIVFERNLGPDTKGRAQRIAEFDPDTGWRAP